MVGGARDTLIDQYQSPVARRPRVPAVGWGRGGPIQLDRATRGDRVADMRGGGSVPGLRGPAAVASDAGAGRGLGEAVDRDVEVLRDRRGLPGAGPGVDAHGRLRAGAPVLLAHRAA